MRDDIYYDSWCVIGLLDDGKTAFYADNSCTMYLEFSVEVARFIVERLRNNLMYGYKLIDFIYNKRAYRG